LVGDQIGAHKFLSGGIQPIGRHGQVSADGALGVEAQASGIGHGEQKQVKRIRRVAQALDVVLAHQALVDPAELRGIFRSLSGSSRCFSIGGLLHAGG